ncbi:MAG: SDR family oxidoreductase [Euryarchaeota archaeon]|nr:SDR family oxidoreductase [Euryarchaeota archaeon]
MLPAGCLKGRTAIVTGGGTGIGRAIALTLGHLGANVVVASRKREHLEPVVKELEARGAGALAVPTDVRVMAEVQRMVAAAKERFGRVDILVNNASGNFVSPAMQLSVNGWNAVTGIVLNGTFFCSQAAGREMVRQKYGRIVNIVSTMAWTGGPGTSHNASAKAGVIAMTKTLAVEWSPHNIRVNAVAPGPIFTEGAMQNLFPNPEVQRRLRDHVPVKRFGDPMEIANIVGLLVSDWGDYINGDVITVDGGSWLGQGIMEMFSVLPAPKKKTGGNRP